MCDYAVTEHVAFVAIGLFKLPTIFDNLWCHITHRSTPFIAFIVDSLINKQREPEINDMGLEGGEVDKYILRFQVSMNNPGVMDVFEPFQNLPEQVDDKRRVC